MNHPSPLVSVIVSTYDSLTFLREALASVRRQSLGPDAIEVIVTDDGSTDETWPYLKSLAREWPQLTIFRQQNSGGPSAGRNRGIESASGRYLFFLDADDWLGDDALRRLTDAAESNNSDVVLGRGRGVNRGVHKPTFVRTVLDADILDDKVWAILGPWKLIRADLIHRIGATFPEDMRAGEDQIFVSQCYFSARKVTILADYDYYYVRGQDERPGLSRTTQSLNNKLLIATRMTEIILANTEPGARRSQFFRRVIVLSLGDGLSRPFDEAAVAERAQFLQRIKSEVLPHLSAPVLREAPDHHRLRLATAIAGDHRQLFDLNRLMSSPLPLVTKDGAALFDLTPELNKLLGSSLRVAKNLTIDHKSTITSVDRRGHLVRIVGSVPRCNLPIDSLHVVFTPRQGEPAIVTGSAVDHNTWDFCIDPRLSAIGGLLRPTAIVEWKATLRALSAGATVAESPLAVSDGSAGLLLWQRQRGGLRLRLIRSSIATSKNRRLVLRAQVFTLAAFAKIAYRRLRAAMNSVHK